MTGHALRIALCVIALAYSTAPANALQSGDTGELIERFIRADPAERDAQFAELRELIYAEELGMVLGRRAERVAESLRRGRTLRRIEEVAEQRRLLDESREHALELIFDEERYFTPYRPPEVTSERAAEYRKVQEEIDAVTEQITELYESKKGVKVKTSFVEAAKDFAWCLEQRNALGTGEAVPEDHEIPSWVLGLPSGSDVSEVNIRNFAWDAAERKALDWSVKLRRTNSERSAFVQERAQSFPEERVPLRMEMEQVRKTNDYRARMGRHALLWNPQLHEAAHKHSAYMSRWGVLSHIEERSPEFYDLHKRTRRAGYEFGFGENVAMGSSGPTEVHEAWRHSAGHHRNLLRTRATEMASARSGSYWTQNFGGRPITDEILNDWRDLPVGPSSPVVSSDDK